MDDRILGASIKSDGIYIPKREAPVLKDGVTRHTLYRDEVILDFNPKSPKYRYTVTDIAKGVKEKSTRGVTSILKDVIAKPDLMTWPMNLSHKKLFGTVFDEKLSEYVHKWGEALLKPGQPYTEDELHNMMMDGSRQWTQRSDQGKDIGTLVHSMIEHYLKKDGVVVNTDEYNSGDVAKAMKAFTTFKEWWSNVGGTVLDTERVIYSRGMDYAGTFDLLAKIGGKVYLLDVKTTNASKKAPLGIYPEYFIQLGAYSYAFREETGQLVDDLGVIRVGKDGRLNIATSVDIGLDRDSCERASAFAVRLHDWLGRVSPMLADAHFKSHLMPDKAVPVDKVDESTSISNGGKNV